MLRKVEEAMQVDALAIERARARVLAAVGPSPALDDGAEQVVDLERAWITAIRDGEVAFEGRCLLVAHVDDAGSWRWGFEEPGAPAAATREVRALVRGDADLFEISLSPRLALPGGHFALRLATWIAVRGGFTGACAHAAGDGRTALLAVELAVSGGSAIAPAPWCSACGRAAAGSRFVARDGVALCPACVADLRALGEPHPFDPRRVVFEGTLRTPEDLVTLRAAFGSAPNLELTDVRAGSLPGTDASLCLHCGRGGGTLLALNHAFTICPACADACANRAGDV